MNIEHWQAKSAEYKRNVYPRDMKIGIFVGAAALLLVCLAIVMSPLSSTAGVLIVIPIGLVTGYYNRDVSRTIGWKIFAAKPENQPKALPEGTK